MNYKNTTLHFLLTVLTLSLLGCEKLGSLTGDDWELTDKQDKLTGERNITATKRISDEAAPLVLTDVEVNCRDKDKLLSLTLTTYNANEKDGHIPPMPMDLEKTLFGGNLVHTRSGKNSFDVPAFHDKYNNQATLYMSTVTFSGLGGLESLEKEFHEHEWIIRVPTNQGDVTITIDMNASNIKKVYETCNWTPEYAATPEIKARREKVNHQSQSAEPLEKGSGSNPEEIETID